MLIIKDLADLKMYLEIRLEMAERQEPKDNGMVYAFKESLQAVEALTETVASESQLLTSTPL